MNGITASAPTKKSLPKISEDFLHYIWKTRSFDLRNLITTSGQSIKISKWGMHNHKAGPDFLDAQIRSSDIMWAGHVEIHVRSSDWYRHHHQVDPAYDQVILHVVWEDDRPVTDMHLNPIPTLVLEDLVDVNLLFRASNLISRYQQLPCQHQIGGISAFWLNAWKERQLIERLEYRYNDLVKRLEVTGGDWEQVTMEYLFRAMGFHANSDTMQQLAQQITWPLMRKNIHDDYSLSALIFGQAGLLGADFIDDYPRALKKEYTYLIKKYRLRKSHFMKWNFKAARPANFPTIRLAQLTALFTNRTSWLRILVENQGVEKLRSLFHIYPSAYWKTHYVFDKPVEKTRISLSKTSVDKLLLNFVIPILYAYGRENNDDAIKDKTIHLLYALAPEQNNITKLFQSAGVVNRCAAESQAVLHTYREYCSKKRCLSCQLGCHLVQQVR